MLNMKWKLNVQMSAAHDHVIHFLWTNITLVAYQQSCDIRPVETHVMTTATHIHNLTH